MALNFTTLFTVNFETKFIFFPSNATSHISSMVPSDKLIRYKLYTIIQLEFLIIFSSIWPKLQSCDLCRLSQWPSSGRVLILLLTDSNKLLMQWRGPYTLESRVGANDYRVKMRSKMKTYQVNMLKKFISREPEGNVVPVDDTDGTTVAVAGVIHQDVDPELREVPDLDGYCQREGVRDVRLGEELPEDQRRVLKDLVRIYIDVFTDMPGETDVIQHQIRLTDDTPIRCKPYPLPYAMREELRNEVDIMLEMGVVRPSTSPHASPIIMVKKVLTGCALTSES